MQATDPITVSAPNRRVVEDMGVDKYGGRIKRYSLFAEDGIAVRILNLGATITDVLVPNSTESEQNNFTNVVLGFNDIERYKNNHHYVGSIAGRYCNRIAQGQFQIGELSYFLDLNDGKHHLHGGSDGYHSRIWETISYNERELVLRMMSRDGDQGYPGNLEILIRYRLNDLDCLEFSWQAISDQETIVNLTQHSYFNLAGSGNIFDHYLRIPSEQYTPVDSELIPTGEIVPVQNTVFDFQNWRRLGDRLETLPEELVALNGFDHNWARKTLVEPLGSRNIEIVAELYHPENEILLTVEATQPGLHFYSGNNLDVVGFQRHGGLCLESQYYPDSPNQAAFPSVFLAPDSEISHQTNFNFKYLDRSGWP